MVGLGNESGDGPLYRPAAIYFPDADCLEYVRADVPCVHRRVDEYLTLIVDMYSREAIGFKFKGFRSIYIKHLNRGNQRKNYEFVEAVEIFEDFFRELGDSLFEAESRKSGYQKAAEIAQDDRVLLRDLPAVA